MGADRSENSPRRTLGLAAALSIGMGTMVGAGIFVFPGVAGSRAGPAAMLSFALGGVVALLVAACTAELATAMPSSGGGYHYASRLFGPLAGLLVGVGQAVGLTFASAFYLVAFGRYASDLIAGFGFEPGESAGIIALATAVLLTVVNWLGAAKAGRLQTVVVAILTLALAALFGYGVLQVAGVLGEARWPKKFAPHGVASVFTTAALVFTSYLGFVQIATVAGEIRKPARNLPRALIGSVLLVALLYVIAMLVTTSLLSPSRLERLGESATTEVARMLMGSGGRWIVMSAGLFATLSSANASILSSSRALYALGRDGLVPGRLCRVSRRFGTPYLALIAVGVPLCGIVVLVDRLELLAESASALHLLIYAFICASLIMGRSRVAESYDPTFRVPLGRAVGVTGAVACLGLLGLMQLEALSIGAGTLVVAGLWYAVYAKGRYRSGSEDG